VNAGTSTVSLVPTNDTETIGLVNGSGNFILSAASLSHISAGTVNIGNATDSGTFTVSGNLDVSNAYNLVLTTAGNYVADSGQITLGNHNLSVIAAGMASTGAIQATGGNINFSSGGNLTVDGSISGQTVELATTANNSSLSLGGNINATDQVSLTTNGSGAMIRTGNDTITAPTVGFISASGNIGANNTALLTDTSHLNTSTSGSAYLNDTSAVQIGGFNGSAYQLSAGSDVVVGGNIVTTGTVDILATGNITLSANHAITSDASGNSIILSSASGNFVNEAGTNGLSAVDGRWLVYSTDPTDTVMDNLADYNIYYDKTYLLNPPNTISAGNGLLYSVGPVISGNLNTSATPVLVSLPYLLSPIQTPITVIPYQFAQQQQAFSSFQASASSLNRPMLFSIEPVSTTILLPATLDILPNVPSVWTDPDEETALEKLHQKSTL
jgi:hypothetical protein